MSDEFTRIARLRKQLLRTRADVTVNIGDDAAVLAPSAHPQVVSIDVAVEDVHFRRRWARLDVIARRAFNAALSDLAAMGAEPRVAFSSLILPRSLSDEELDSLVDGLESAAEDHGVAVVGGNLAAGRELSITTAVHGEAAGQPLLRSGARVGDAIWVTGTVGGAALGLALLSSDATREGSAAAFIDVFLRPEARIAIGRGLVGRASAAIDISDGLLADLEHLCEASGVGAQLRAGDLPLLPGHVELANRLGIDAIDAALSGGEDYELLFAAAAGTDHSSIATRIGTITKAKSLSVLDATGKPRPIVASGFRHFA